MRQRYPQAGLGALCELFGKTRNAYYDHQRRATGQVARAVRAYNELRPHVSCDFLTPAQAHEREGLLAQRWKDYYQPAPAAKTPTNPYLTPM